MSLSLSKVNFTSVIIASIIAFVLGAVWYNEAVFGGIFMEVMGITEADDTPLKLAVEFVKQFLVCLAVALIAARAGMIGIRDGYKLSFVVGNNCRRGYFEPTHLGRYSAGRNR
ncbi:DUF1761 domain-containing protein, partial [Candidatus Mycalebacterium sp.]